MDNVVSFSFENLITITLMAGIGFVLFSIGSAMLRGDLKGS